MEYIEIRSFALYALYATIWTLALFGGIYVYAGYSDSDDDDSKAMFGGKDEEVVVGEEEDEDGVSVYVNNLFPPVFLTNNHTSRERMEIELWKHHKFLRSFTSPQSEEERIKVLWSMYHVLSLISMIMGVLAVMYDLDVSTHAFIIVFSV